MGVCMRASHMGVCLQLSDAIERYNRCGTFQPPYAVQVIGTIDGSGRIVLVDSREREEAPAAVDLPLEAVLGDMPQKHYTFRRSTPRLEPVVLPPGTVPQTALERVLRLPSVCSKRFLTSKVDRCVTGASHTVFSSSLLLRHGVEETFSKSSYVFF